MTTLVAALIGAIIGSIGAVMAGKYVDRKAEQARKREGLVQRYLFQLQDSIEALWYRVENLESRGDNLQTAEAYFQVTSLYALGRVLAIERILAIEGVYPQLEIYCSTLGQFLKTNRVDSLLNVHGFYQYHRISLAEAVIEYDEQHFRASTYLEFRRRYENSESPERKWLTPAIEAIASLSEKPALLTKLKEIALKISEQTDMPSSLKEK